MNENAYLAYLLDCEIYLIDEPEKRQKTVAPEIKETVQEIKKESPLNEATDLSTTEAQIENIADVEFEGNNTSKIVVIVGKESWIEKNKILLTKILQSINLQLPEIALIKTSRTIIEASELNELIQDYQNILSFGIEVEPAENTISNGGNVNVITSVNLNKLNQDVAAKKLLWKNLKQTFNV